VLTVNELANQDRTPRCFNRINRANGISSCCRTSKTANFVPPAIARKRTAMKTKKTASVEMSEIEQFAQTFNLELKPGFLFRRLHNRGTSLFHNLTRQDDLTPRQFGVLLALFQNGRMTQTTLAKRLFLDRSTLGEMLQRMVERGLVHRRIPDNDRRTAEVWIAPAGKQAMLAIVRHADEAMTKLVEPLPEEYRALFLKCLLILANAEPPVADASRK
jgi:MarR family transcriptional regulator, temperature-dependent positive regulator of motility